MKTVRLITFIIIASLVFSVWTPTAASAKTEAEQVIFVTASNGSFEVANVAYAYIIVDNRTGGLLYIQLEAKQYAKEPKRRSYSFVAFEQGKTKFQILPGRFIYTIRSSNCGGKRLDTRFFKGTINLGTFYCDKKNK